MTSRSISVESGEKEKSSNSSSSFHNPKLDELLKLSSATPALKTGVNYINVLLYAKFLRS